MKKKSIVFAGIMLSLCVGVMPIHAETFSDGTEESTTINLTASPISEAGGSIDEISDSTIISYKIDWNHADRNNVNVIKKSKIPKKWNPQTLKYDLPDEQNTKDFYMLKTGHGAELTIDEGTLFDFSVTNTSNRKINVSGTCELNPEIKASGLALNAPSISIESAAANVSDTSGTGTAQTGVFSIRATNCTNQEMLKSLYSQLNGKTSTIGTCSLVVSAIDE
ncbi:hypothetical protein [Blautia glucerasea]|uniref:hypothetical protein n=1 Tax=Blautia glucerasea TaxID=536633 RepID=UPI001D06091D|nr:hypothetical protein [Blautia glucerasea]MCB6544573.1 hypothetical protein [Blautia glucerasea]